MTTARTEYGFSRSEPFVLEGKNGQDVIACVETFTHMEIEDNFSGSNSVRKRYIVINNTPTKAEIFKLKLMGRIQEDL